MTLSIAIGNALSGLRTSQQAMDVLSNNIANANTPGYTRKTVALESVTVSNFGRGVQIADIVREVDEYLNADFRLANSTIEKLRINLQYAESIEQLYGQPGANNSIANTVTDFRSALTALETAPENQGLREQALQDGIRLADRLNTESAAIQDLRGDAEREIGSIVNRVNSLLDQISDINHQVIRGTAQQQDVNALKDQRANYVNEIATYLDVKVRESADGNLVVTTGIGRTLVDNTVTHPLATTTLTNVNASTVFNPITIDGIDVTDELRAGQGQIAAHLDARGTNDLANPGSLESRQTELDRIASALFTNLTSADLATTDTTAGVNDDSNHFFSPYVAADPITAYNIQVHPDLVADNSLLNDLAAADDLNVAVNASYTFAAVTNGTSSLTVGFVEYANAIIEGQALRSSNTELTYKQQEYVTNSLEQRVGQVSGVNIDEELAQMLQFQKSFAAAGRLIQVTSEMLDNLINIVGR
ncbi:MAG: flagellar hook-associated protein FlgK [Sneathiellaceae bacterium]